jgi:hypothetical protein
MGWPADEHAVDEDICREEIEIEGLKCNVNSA